MLFAILPWVLGVLFFFLESLVPPHRKTPRLENWNSEIRLPIFMASSIRPSVEPSGMGSWALQLLLHFLNELWLENASGRQTLRVGRRKKLRLHRRNNKARWREQERLTRRINHSYI